MLGNCAPWVRQAGSVRWLVCETFQDVPRWAQRRRGGQQRRRLEMEKPVRKHSDNSGCEVVLTVTRLMFVVERVVPWDTPGYLPEYHAVVGSAMGTEVLFQGANLRLYRRHGGLAQ